jgi:two-component system, cell cycle sensor histidine kinase and response regulator CckA
MNVEPQSPAKILVVEDESVVATDLQRTLIRMGYTVLEPATSAEEAIDAVREHSPNLVLMDIRIHGERDGIETAEALKEMYGVPVVYLTAYADAPTIERAKRTDPMGYLLKPFKPKDLRSTVEIALHRHQVETQLRERTHWFQAVLNSIADGVVATDAHGAVTFINARAEVLTGHDQADALGRPIEAVVLLKSWEGHPLPSPVRDALATRQSLQRSADSLLVSVGGSEIAVNDNTAAILDHDRLVGAVVAFRDVREQRSMRKQLEFQDRLTAVGTMAAAVAHEINNPLSVIIANLALLEELTRHVPGPDVEESRAVLVDVRHSADRIRTIVSDLSSFAKPSRDQLPSVDVLETLQWAVRSTAAAFKDRARVSILTPSLPAVAIERQRLEQVLINLLLNSAHAIPPGSAAENSVSIEAHQSNPDEVVIEVRDSGRGISESVSKTLFMPFVTTKPDSEGTGLGLYVSRNIVSSVGGRLEFESVVGSGTVFRVTLPVASHLIPLG